MDVKGRRILIVEDEAVVALDVARRLRGMGFEIVGPVDSGEAALELCHGPEAVDAILMDVRLQGALDGIEAAERIAEVCHVPIVFLTAFSDAHTLDRIAGIEPYGYLLKPLDERALWVTLHTALRRHDQERERALAEKRQQLSDARYRAILDQSPDGIVSVDVDHRVVVFNRGAEAMFGWTAGKALGAPLSAFIPAAAWDRHRSFLEAVTTGDIVAGQGTLRESVGLRSTGESFPMEVSLSRLNFDGEVMVTAIVRDLTERKRLEAQFKHSQKLETMGRLASSVAHDFNNQLVPIGGYAELLCRSLAEGDMRRQDAEEIRAATQRAARLTRQLLMYARRDLPQPVPVVVDELVGELSGMMRRLLGSDIAIDFKLDAPAISVCLDPSCLEQIVMNLVVNARDAVVYGGSIKLFTEATLAGDVPVLSARAASEPWLRISVSDTGQGIPAELRESIFEPFFTTKAAGLGTGLGLSTVMSIVQQSQGVLDLVSEVGQGATFHVYLPVHSRRTSSPPPIQEPTVPGANGGPFRVLVVDDDDDVLRFTGRVLREAGYEVTLARTPREALARCPHPLHLLISDMVLPGFSGAELASRIVEREDCAVLFTTGYADEDLQRRGLSLSGSEILRKPYGARDLEAAAMNQELGFARRKSVPR